MALLRVNDEFYDQYEDFLKSYFTEIRLIEKNEQTSQTSFEVSKIERETVYDVDGNSPEEKELTIIPPGVDKELRMNIRERGIGYFVDKLELI